MISSYLTLTHLQHVIYRSSVQGILTNAPNDVRAMFHSNVKQMWVRYPHSSLTLKISNSFCDEWHYLLLTLFTVEIPLKNKILHKKEHKKDGYDALEWEILEDLLKSISYMDLYLQDPWTTLPIHFIHMIMSVKNMKKPNRKHVHAKWQVLGSTHLVNETRSKYTDFDHLMI